MTPERWRQVNRLFYAARQRPAEERGVFVSRQAAEDGALAAEVLSLLASEAQAGDFLEEPIARLVEPTGDRESPRRIGAYQLLRPLSRGGMGTVYLGQRADDAYQGRVAIKVLRQDLMTSEMVRRFEIERQVLADLEHPHIARLLDGGTTPDGLPYLVMELVEGEPIDSYCQRKDLGLTARLELFCKVARAVHVAHQSLVVHRDLKPANILVTREGDPKLIDFGIAKPLELAAAATLAGRAPLTLEHASPEQLRCRPVTTASDVYALGVLLYELLAGQRPFLLAEWPFDHLVREVCERSPELISKVVARALPGLPLPRLRRRLAGDLDTIAAKALAKEPQRRYRSAAALARDLERHLEGRPVRARPDSWTYRLGKLLGRHRLATAVAAAVLLGFIGFTSALYLSRQDANQQQAHSEAVTELMISIFGGSNPEPLQGEVTRSWASQESQVLRQLIDQAGVQLTDRLDRDPERKAVLLAALGDIRLRLGDFEGAEEHLTEAHGLFLAVHGRRHERVARVLQLLGQHDLELARYESAARRYRESMAARPCRGRWRQVCESGHAGLAEVLRRQGDLEGAAKHGHEALALARQLNGPNHEKVARNHQGLAETRRTQGQRQAAQEHFEKALGIYLDLQGEKHGLVSDVYDSLGLLAQDRGDYGAAQSYLGKAVALRREVYGPAHPRLAESQHNLAALLRKRGELEAGAALCQQALELRREAFGERHPRVAISLNLLGQFESDAARFEQAEQRFGKAIEIWEEALGEDHFLLASALTNLGGVLLRQGRDVEAQGAYLRALGISQKNAERSIAVARDHQNLSLALRRLGRLEEAEDHLRIALDILLGVLGGQHTNTATVQVNLASLLRQRGHLAEAENLLHGAEQIFLDRFGEIHVTVGKVQNHLSLVHEQAGQTTEAVNTAKKAVEILQQVLPAKHPDLAKARQRLVQLQER